MMIKKEKQRKKQINYSWEHKRKESKTKHKVKSEKLLKEKPQFEINCYKKVFVYKVYHQLARKYDSFSSSFPHH